MGGRTYKSSILFFQKYFHEDDWPMGNSPIRIGILTASERVSRGERPDLGGSALEEMSLEQGWVVIRRAVLPDDLQRLRETMREWADCGEIDVLLTTGGTGFGRYDVTPEATLKVIKRHAPGMAEAMRMESLKITPHAILSRGVTGIRGATLIINLPGSPKGAVEQLAVVSPALPHAVQLLRDSPDSEAGH